MSFQLKQKQIQEAFSACSTSEMVYHKIMEFGKTLPPFDPAWKTEENRVQGCQSLMYVHAEKKNDLLYFAADSDAFISRGLAALLVFLYSGEPPQTILKEPPLFLESLGVLGALTPGRANGFSSLYLRMKQEAIKHLL